MLQSGGDTLHFVLRLPDRDAGPEPCDDTNRVITAVLTCRIDRERDEHLGRVGGRQDRPSDIAKGCRHNPDHLVALAVDGDELTDDCGSAAESASPKRLAEHGDTRRADALVGGLKGATGDRSEAQHLEHGGGDGAARHALGLSAISQRGGERAEHTQRFESGRALGPREVIERRHPKARHVGRAVVFEKLHQTASVGIWQGAEQDSVHNAEDRRAAADAERNGEKRRGGDDRRAPEETERLAQVLAQQGQVLPRSGANDIAKQREPQPNDAFVRSATTVDVRHLLAVLLAELSGVKP